MGKITILPPEVIAKIAAGEVVERPASALKELLENSLDAQATSIEITISNAGKTLIQIKDNGTGIAEDDIQNIFHRHATSKIKSIEDLYRIGSLGFRGEALYSISSIADITLRSKTKEQECGWEIHLRGNEKLSRKPYPMQSGTEIAVKELFFNTPARKKFLKRNTTELNALLDIFIPYTILYPAVRFSFTHEGKKLIDLMPAKDLVSRMSAALHLEQKHILEETRTFSEDNISIHLVLGDMNIQRTRKDLQFIFINNRPVQNRAISFHINDIYRLLFSSGVYSFFCIFITMPADELDVNVHPAKREVKIKDETRLISLLRHFAEHLLMTKSKAKQMEKQIARFDQRASERVSFPHPAPSVGNTLSLNDNILLFKTDEIKFQNKSNLKEKLKHGRYLGVLLKKYLLFETPNSLLVIDQHAAHERINFEKLKQQIDNGKIEIQQLLTPILLKLSHQEILLWEESQSGLEKAGFSCTLFDKQTLAIHAHPQLITTPEESVRNLLAGENIERMDAEELARLACHASITAGLTIAKEEVESLKKQLLLCNNPFICPHGRPTVIEFSEETISKQFLRT